MWKKRVLPPTYLLISLFVMAVLRFAFPASQIVKLPWNLLGVIPLAVGIWLNLAADHAFRRADTTVKPFVESTALITSGVYRISRHPMYLGFTLVLLGVAILLAALTPFLFVPLFALVMDRLFIAPEEEMLEQRFGLTWLEYKHRVRRWL
ncbi:MAG: isoprenylcysteine carboxylmethyltransferase family protein [Chloroflexi bacterium]|nr:isoprenylcysteine carboxylmethyltransferase family protein [Chloroflexota bacterium]